MSPCFHVTAHVSPLGFLQRFRDLGLDQIQSHKFPTDCESAHLLLGIEQFNIIEILACSFGTRPRGIKMPNMAKIAKQSFAAAQADAGRNNLQAAIGQLAYGLGQLAMAIDELEARTIKIEQKILPTIVAGIDRSVASEKALPRSR